MKIEIKSDRINREKRREKKKLISLLSRFPWFGEIDSERSTKDEVLKPLYHIVGDIDSEQLEPTVESIDDASVDQKRETNKTCQQQRRTDFLRSRSFRGILCRLKKIREGETGSVRIANSTRMNENEGNERTIHRRLGRMELKGLKKPRNLRLPFLPSSRCRSPPIKNNSSEFSCTSIEQNDENTQDEADEETTDSDYRALNRPTTLGVKFAHPVYTGKRHLVMNEDNRGSSNEPWNKSESHLLDVDVDDRTLPPPHLLFEVDDDTLPPPHLFLEVDDRGTLPPRNAIVETAKAERRGSGTSSSLYPTDEQSIEDENFYYGGFDSDVDIPFDEIFTDPSFFELD